MQTMEDAVHQYLRNTNVIESADQDQIIPETINPVFTTWRGQNASCTRQLCKVRISPGLEKGNGIGYMRGWYTLGSRRKQTSGPEKFPLQTVKTCKETGVSTYDATLHAVSCSAWISETQAMQHIPLVFLRLMHWTKAFRWCYFISTLAKLWTYEVTKNFFWSCRDLA